MSHKADLTLALYQCPAIGLEVAGNLQRLAHAAQRAKAQGADVLVCPEMFLTGYNIGPGAVAQLAEPADGPMAQAVAQVARQHHLALVYGYPERGNQGAVFNAAQWISAQGQRRLNYRKTHLFGDLDRTQFSAGAVADGGPTLVELNGWRIGMLICYDVEFPENTRRWAHAGAELVVVPTANMVDYDFVARAVVPVRAFENQIYLAYANFCGTEAPLAYGGLSTVAAPDGRVLACAGREETLVLATLRGSDLDTARRIHSHLADSR